MKATAGQDRTVRTDMTLGAVFWDVDGTLAETERDGHRVAFNLAFEDFGLPWRWGVEHYGALLDVAGGRERLMHDMQVWPDAPARPDERQNLARALHERKNGFYADIVGSRGIPLRPGVRELIAQCEARAVRMAITTTTSRRNVDALLRPHFGSGWADCFATLVCGEEVSRKKPDPEVYDLALDRLGLRGPDAIAIEDSPAGAAAAIAAGVSVVVTRSAYFADARFDTAMITGTSPEPALIAIGPGLERIDGWKPPRPSTSESALVGLDDLIVWHRRIKAPARQD